MVKARFVAKFSDNGTLQAKQDSFRLARDSGVQLCKSDYPAKWTMNAGAHPDVFQLLASGLYLSRVRQATLQPTDDLWVKLVRSICLGARSGK